MQPIEHNGRTAQTREVEHGNSQQRGSGGNRCRLRALRGCVQQLEQEHHDDERTGDERTGDDRRGGQRCGTHHRRINRWRSVGLAGRGPGG